MYRSILIATDGTHPGRCAVERGRELAVRYGARVFLVSPCRPVPEARLAIERRQTPTELQWMIHAAEDVDHCLEEALEELHAAGLSVVAHAPRGKLGHAIVRIIDDIDPDLVVVGDPVVRRLPFRRTVAERVARQTNTDLMVVRDRVVSDYESRSRR